MKKFLCIIILIFSFSSKSIAQEDPCDKKYGKAIVIPDDGWCLYAKYQREKGKPSASAECRCENSKQNSSKNTEADTNQKNYIDRYNQLNDKYQSLYKQVYNLGNDDVDEKLSLLNEMKTYASGLDALQNSTSYTSYVNNEIKELERQKNQNTLTLTGKSSKTSSYISEKKSEAQEKLKEIEIAQKRDKWQKRKKELELSAEERRKVAQITAHLNTIDKYESYGMSNSDARRFANNESKMQFQKVIISNAFNTAGNLILDGINRREEAMSDARDYVRKYKKSIELAAKKLQNYDFDYSKNLDEKFKEKYDDLDNIDDLKKAILEYIYAWDNYTFSTNKRNSEIYMDDYLIVQQKIESAKFNEDNLEVIYFQEAQKSSRDKNSEYMGYDKKSWLTFQPTKYTHQGYLFLNTETGEKNIYEGTTWKTSRGLEALPVGDLIKTEDYRKQVKNLSSESYYIPDRPSNFGFYFGQRGSWIYSQMHKLKKLIEKEKIKNINTEDLNYKITSKLDIFLSLKPNRPYIIKRKENISGSSKEISIFAFNGEDYIIYTIPDPSIVKTLFKDEINVDSPEIASTYNRLVKYKSSKGNKEKKWFAMGNSYNNVFFGNDDLLWIGEQYTKFTDDVYYTYSKSRNGVVADLDLSENQNKDYLNPYIETGKISKTVDYSLITDSSLKASLNNNNFKDKTGLPIFQIRLLRTNLCMLLPKKKGDFVMYDNSAKDSNSKQKYLYFKMTNYSTHYARRNFEINNNDVNADFYKSQVYLDENLEKLTPENYNLSSIIRLCAKSFVKVESSSISYFTSSDYRTIYEIIPSLLKSCKIQ